MAIVKENDLINLICIVKIHVLYLDAQKFRTLLFLCELSQQKHNNISDLAARYTIYGVNAHKEIINKIFGSSTRRQRNSYAKFQQNSSSGFGDAIKVKIKDGCQRPRHIYRGTSQTSFEKSNQWSQMKCDNEKNVYG